MAKNFTGMNTGRAYSTDKEAREALKKPKTAKQETSGKVYAAIEQATSRKGQQGKASPQEAAERASELKTQGRKGCKAIRINMAFTPDNHEFIKVMSRASGRTMTEMCNEIISAYRNEHPEFMEKAAGFLEFINSGAFSAKE